jgi:hypothetical protein
LQSKDTTGPAATQKHGNIISYLVSIMEKRTNGKLIYKAGLAEDDQI